MINTVALTGRLTYEPELRSTSNGVSVCRFQIAVDRNYTPKGEERKADFIDITAWRQTAEFVCRYFRKGSMIGVEGSIQTDNFTDRDGNKRKSVIVVANDVSFCGSKAEADRQENTQEKQYKPVYKGEQPFEDFEEIADDDDNLPF